MITVYVNGKATQVLKNTKALHACTKAGYPVPHLCYHEDLPAFGNCGVCMVDINGRNVRACSTPCEEGMQIKTTSKALLDLRREAVEIILSNHPNNCPECIKNGRCELQERQELAIRHMHLKKVKRKYKARDESSPSITLDPSYCIQCGRCVYVCNEIQDVHALQNSDRGFETYVGPTFERELESSECVKCGQCSAYCPVAAIYETDDSDPLWEALNNPELILVAQEAPAVRVALGEEFGMKPGTNVKGKMYSALRELGFKYVFDTNFGADLTIMEEASEFVHLFKHHPEKFPLITTCCPSWVDYLEKFHSDLIPQFSSSKSPHQMVGTMVKTYWAEKLGLDPNKIFLVSVMPCTAKKYEIERMEDMYASGRKDVDLTITTRELARMLKTRGIDLTRLEDGVADNPLGEYSGAGTIFGATGGVMEAALRTAYYLATGSELPDPKIDFVRGAKGIKKGKIELLGQEIRIGVASGLGNVSKLMNEIRAAQQAGKEPPYHFVEVMACTGGCVGGGGQPYRSTNRVRAARAKGLYKEDEHAERRESHNNESIQNLYKEYLDAPNSPKAKKLLHTSYIARPDEDRKIGMIKPDKTLIYPLFIPMQGCPGSCVYCDQRKITGAGLFDLHQAVSEVRAFIRRNSGRNKEVAFYGGTFTALPQQTQNEYLENIASLLEPSDSIRISTHPVYIDADILGFLKARRVQSIELGIQDFNDDVLMQSGRGYSAETASKAVQIVRNAGFVVGLQLMPGLPGSSPQSNRQNLDTVLSLQPDLLRLYPTVVIQGTALEAMYLSGAYQPLGIVEAVQLCADYQQLCEPRGIRIIKYGLPSNIEPREVTAGAYHPAFGELVKQELLRRLLAKDPQRKDRLSPMELQLLRAHGGGISS